MISERLLDIRTDDQMKQSEMAKILKTSQSNYSRWESGKELIPIIKLNLLCNYFDVSMDYIIGLIRTNKKMGHHELDKKVVGNNIKHIRKSNNLTQKELAEILNTSQSTISAYESGKTIILTAFALELVKRYNISLDWLCGRTKK